MKPRGDTLFQRAIETADDEMGGRYAKQHQTIITAAPNDGPPLLAVPQWSADSGALPIEPPLNEDVNALSDLGLASAPAAPPAPANSGFRPFPGDAVEREASADDFSSDDEEQS
jgi:hypothetical protein